MRKNAIGKVQKLRSDLEGGQRPAGAGPAGVRPQPGRRAPVWPDPRAEKAAGGGGADRQRGARPALCCGTRSPRREIARIIQRWTGIPVARLMEGEREKLLHLEDILHRRVVGQDEAVRLVSEAILRSRAGIADPGKPIGSLPVPGPPPAWARPSWPRPWLRPCLTARKNLVRIDMSEYMEKFSVSRLIGAPPGYVGYEGRADSSPRRCGESPTPSSLFDEVERPTRMCSISRFRCWTTGGSPTARAHRGL